MAAAIDAQGLLGPGDRLSDLVGDVRVSIFRWVPDYADDIIRVGDYVLLDPEAGRHYGGPRGKRLSAYVKAGDLEYRQGNEYKFQGARDRRGQRDRDFAAPRDQVRVIRSLDELRALGARK